MAKKEKIMKLLGDYWYKKKDRQIDNEEILLDYIKKFPSKRIELKKIFVDTKIFIKKEREYDDNVNESLMSYATFNKHLTNLRDMGKILLDQETKIYTYNQYYIEFYEDAEKQIWFQNIINRNIPITKGEIRKLEIDLWGEVLNNIKISHNFGENLKDEIIYGEDANNLVPYFIFNFLREIYLMNPEMWNILKRPKDFDFKIIIECNFHNIFELVEKLKAKYKELGYLQQFPLNDPQLNKNERLEIKYKNRKYNMINRIPLDKSDLDFHKDAVYFDFQMKEVFKKYLKKK